MTKQLLLGPLVRYVDETSASLWVKTRDPGRVTVRAGAASWDAGTFTVHGHHYAMVVADGLEPGTITPYAVEVDGQAVWPPAEGEGSDYPPSVIATLKPGKPLRMAFGSCRTSVGHDEAGNKTHGVDALRALALKMATDTTARWPDLVLFLGDQVYADETTEAMQEFIRARRDIEVPPGKELKDFEEYSHLYELAWSDPLNRWLLSTLPSSMIFDDHDVRDDWNTSYAWKQDIEQTDWWHERIISGLMSYWVYQHLGNLSPQERKEDDLWQRVVQADDGAELDLTGELRAKAERVYAEPESFRWSYARDFGDVRLVVVDSRAARVLEPDRRQLLDDSERDWLDEQLRGDVRHLLIGTSLPFLLPAGMHYLEAWNEAVAKGKWGRRAAALGERLRRTVDLEHWGAFQESFQDVARMVTEVADGKRGAAPQTVTFLSGDVHHSYLAEVEREGWAGSSRIIQAVCSPIRNPLKRRMRFATAALSYAVAGPIGKLMSRSAKVPHAPFHWHYLAGPWFDNSIALLEDRPEGLSVSWHVGVVQGGDHLHPQLQTIADELVEPR
ncbi:MAG: alkaline phosphatase D family protein [Nocardioidaceae bacterium]